MHVRTVTFKKDIFGEYSHWLEGNMDKHLETMLENGWDVINSTGLRGHVMVGSTLRRAALTGGLSLLFGASRTRPEITITYRKDEPIQRAIDALNGRR